MAGNMQWKRMITQVSTNSLRYSVLQYLLCAYYMSGTVLGTGDKAMEQKIKCPSFTQVVF